MRTDEFYIGSVDIGNDRKPEQFWGNADN